MQVASINTAEAHQSHLEKTPSLIAAEDIHNIPGEFSASLALTTDYIFRGVSQNANSHNTHFPVHGDFPSFQGSIDYSLFLSEKWVGTPVENVSFNAGVWASTPEFWFEPMVEVDYYGGFSGEIKPVGWDKGVGWDVGLIYFSIPDSSSNSASFWEGNANLGYDFDSFAVSTGINISPDFNGESGDSRYYTAGIDIPLFKSLALSGHFGHQTADEFDDYSDVKVGLSADVLGFGTELAYHDTFDCKADGSPCSLFLGGDHTVFTISRSF